MAQLILDKTLEGSWSLVAVNSVQTSLSFDWAVTFTLDADTAIRIECPFTLLNRVSAPIELDPQSNPESLAPVLALVRRYFTELKISSFGEMHISFDGGYQVAIKSSPMYEAWDLWYENSIHLICLPGGGMAEWTSKDK